MWACRPHPLGVFTPNPTMLTHCLCCAFGAWKHMCSTVATRRFRVRTRGAIRKPSHQTKTGSPRKKQPHRGCGFCFKDKATQTRRIITTMISPTPPQEEPQKQPPQRTKTLSQVVVQQQEDKYSASVARASGNSPIERVATSP